MDTRNYDEENDCGLNGCDCREDNTCGCSFPNNIANFLDLETNKDCNCCKEFDKTEETSKGDAKKQAILVESPSKS